MNADERQALREKHAVDEKEQCSYCVHEFFPCDVVKMLNAYEELHDDNEKMSQVLSVALGLSQSLAKMIP